MNYGIPYKGSKSQIASWIVSTLPEADTLVDLFAGGGAVTHCAMLSGKYKHFIINDIEPGLTQLFVDAANGKYHDEERWISREMFEMLKGSDPYVRYVWSFGNNGRDYLYAPEIERFKEHLHYMFFAKSPREARLRWKAFIREFGKVKTEIAQLTVQVEALCAECGIGVVRKADGTIDAAHIKDTASNVIGKGMREYMRKALKESGKTAADVDKLLGTNGMAGHYFGAPQWALPTEEAYKKMQTILPGLAVPWPSLKASLESLERLESLQSLESLERLQSLESLESLERLESLESLESDYRDVPIPPNSVIYCDIPYKGTNRYNSGAFDYDSFYDWACSQTQPVYISEYSMPKDRFEIVAEKEKRCTLSAASNVKKTTERIYRPRR